MPCANSESTIPTIFATRCSRWPPPTLAGLVFGKLFELAWRKSVGRKAVLPDGTTDKRKELALNLVFGVASAGLGALVSQLSDRGSQALVDRRHSRQSRRIR